jgi:hypothetical protein
MAERSDADLQIHLGGWRKVLRANPERISRFHTARGRLMPASAWIALPGTIAKRFRAAQPTDPWMVAGAVRWLDRNLPKDARVLELGSGSSTAWFAQRAREVVSLEDDSDWGRATQEQLKATGLDNCEVQLVALPEIPNWLEQQPAESFDLVVVDSNEGPGFTRVDGVDLGRRLVRPGGCLLLDDSDRPPYLPADDLLAGWQVNRFVGVKPVPLMAVETSVYRRPDS